MNCSDALLDATPKYALEIGLKPLKEGKCKFHINDPFLDHCGSSSDVDHLLLLTESVLIVEKFERIKDNLHRDEGVVVLLYKYYGRC